MIRFGKAVVRHRVVLLIVAALLLIPSVFGIMATRVNYDILYYLPGDIETMQGQDILMDEFGTGAFAMFMAEGMEDKQVAALKEQIQGVEHVKSVVWYDDAMDIAVPKEILPKKVYEAFNKGDTTMMAIFFDETMASDETMEAVEQIRRMAGEQCFLSGMSAVVTDTRNLAQREEPIYVAIAVVLACMVMALFLDSFLAPLLFLLSIGMAIVYNLGTNCIIGEISYITKALSAVLQLGVTMDYSIFLWHSYCEQKERFNGDKERAMAHAIKATISSIVGSSITTIAGFVALCFMSFALGADLGIVLAKGVVFGLIACVTILPSMILIFDKALARTSHRPLLPQFDGVCSFIVRHYRVFAIVFLVLLVPALYGYTNTKVYYNLSDSLPKDLQSIVANEKLSDTFDMSSTHMALVDAHLPEKDARSLTREMEQIAGVKSVLGLETLIGPAVPKETLPNSIRQVLESDNYRLLLITSQYDVASDQVNLQIDQLEAVVKKYDQAGMVIGEAPCTRDLIRITDRDFQVVSAISIVAIFVIILLVLRSISLPVILVAVIELAIFINMGIPFYTGEVLPFIASIVIGTIQLGATVDYAILMTTRYKRERNRGAERRQSVETALKASIHSIIVSALGFFAATFGVAVYSEIDMISALCMLMARGAVISMVIVICILPAMLMVFDKWICKTSMGFLPNKGGI